MFDMLLKKSIFNKYSIMFLSLIKNSHHGI